MIDTIDFMENPLTRKSGIKGTAVRGSILIGLALLGLVAMFDEFFELPEQAEAQTQTQDVGQKNNASFF